MVFLSAATHLIAATLQSGTGTGSADDYLRPVIREQVRFFVPTDYDAPGTAWEPPILDGRFSVEVCRNAFDIGNYTIYFEEFVTRFALTDREAERLRYECNIWYNGFEYGQGYDSDFVENLAAAPR